MIVKETCQKVYINPSTNILNGNIIKKYSNFCKSNYDNLLYSKIKKVADKIAT